jgi:ABC-2 type transport system ATP-binding protein
MSEAWIDLEGVSLSRGGRPVLNEISARLSGGAVGLVGANGAGKSTLIGALLGVLKISRGRVRVLDMEIPVSARELRTRSGVMAEQAGVFPGGSGVDAVSFAGMISGLGKRESLRKAHRALDALDVGEERYRLTKGYSTGMRQRCKLAMSLVHDPELLILDEPTVGLDPPGRLQLLSLIRELRDQGRRILLSTHIMQDAEFLCDEILLLDTGTVSYCGGLADMMAGVANTMKAEVAGERGDLVDLLTAAGLQGVSGSQGILTFAVASEQDLNVFWRVMLEHNLEVRSLGRDLTGLEDTVVNMMEGGHE